jgi:16S rRNA pseudouridine516 synthase
VSVDGIVVSDAGFHVNDGQEVKIDDTVLHYEEYIYIMLNKPAGYITATHDSNSKTVMDLIDEKRADLSIVGRLDKDTEGLLLITNNGKLNHNMLSPTKHVDKTYYVICDNDLSDDDINRLCHGIDIGDDTPTLEAKCRRYDQGILLTIHEGRYHQIKRMMEAVNNHVTYLKRLTFGPLCLDEDLASGSSRRLTDEEIELIKKYM